jgi:hypothetical protein
MSTNDNEQSTTLDADAIRQLISSMSPPELAIFRRLLIEVKERGSTISDALVKELAKRYADQARHLAGEGGEP